MKGGNVIFNELCFCILTANFNAERALEIQEKIGDGFISLPEKKLAIKQVLKEAIASLPKTRNCSCVHSLKDARL